MADELTSTSEWGHVGIFSLRYLNKHQPSLRRAVLRTQGHNNKRRQKRVKKAKTGHVITFVVFFFTRFSAPHQSAFIRVHLR